MLEIFFVVFLTKKLASIAKAKGRSSGWAALGPVLWILGEIGGAVVGATIGIDDIALYVGALAGAALGAGLAWVVVNSLSSNEAALQGVDDAVAGGHYDPSNPYNAPGRNPYQGAAPRNDVGGPFAR
jgi:hypothetical protein